MGDKPSTKKKSPFGGNFFQRTATLTNQDMKGCSIEGDETIRNFLGVKS